MSVLSRIAKNAIALPDKVSVVADHASYTVTGPKGKFTGSVLANLALDLSDSKVVAIKPTSNASTVKAMSGTLASHLKNAIKGVTEGFLVKLELVGVGYRAQAQGKVLNLTLGFSHPVAFDVPEGITIETPSQTEILIKGIDKSLVGQVAAQIRRYRAPEPYKGKGVKYAGEVIIIKEAKKK